MKKTILTIATGKPFYVDLAVNLARSFYLWHPDSAIVFNIVTDRPELLPADITSKSKITAIKPGELDEGFSSKLYLDKLASEGATLFIDSDCLIFENLDFVFELFKGHKVSVVGGYIDEGEWFGDIRKVCLQFNITRMPKFNGGLYYIEKSEQATAVYHTARQLEKRYDEIGFVRLRNRPNDEVLMALAMQLHEQIPVMDDGTILGDPQACPGEYKIDVISGERCLVNPPAPDERHKTWYPFHKISPAIVHFLGSYTQHFPYKKEVYRLKRASRNKLTLLSELTASFTIQYPEQLKNSVKKILRPLYHRLFGTREIQQSERVL